MSMRQLARRLCAVALAAALAGYAAQAPADDRRGDRDGRDDRQGASCLSRIVGSYLTTIRDSGGGIASRSIIALHDDGVVSAVDSAQGRGVDNAGFSAQLGTYRCTGRHKAKAITLDFSFTAPVSLARTDWTIRVERARRGIAGEAVLYILPDATTADPFAGDLEPLARFTFEGVPVPAKVR